MMVTVTVSPADGRDATASTPPVVRLDVFLLDLPAGTVSTDEAFWRSADESAVGGPAACDALARNGVRAGVVPRDRSAFFSQYFNDHPKRGRRTSYSTGQYGTVDLDLNQHFAAEDLFVFDPAGRLSGRTYEDGTNSVAMTFEPEPRAADAVRVTLCPTVRSDRRQARYTALNEPTDAAVTTTDRVYDLSLSVALRNTQFLIVAPGPEAGRRTSVGNRFLLLGDAAARLERVIVVVPTVVTPNARPTLFQSGRGL